MCLFASLGAASLAALSAVAQTPAPSTAAPSASTSAAPDPAPAKLPYGVDDVLKLSRAQVSEDVTLNFIHNSGTIYNLGPNDIVYLRNEGVSDRVINTMLDQRKNVPAEMAAQTAPAAPPASVNPDPNAAAAQASAQYAPTYVQPAPVYTQPEPTYPPASTVYVIPYSSPGYGYSTYYPYYGSSPYYYYGPSVTFGIGFGGGRYYGGYRGGYRGGYHGGGGHYGYGGHR